MPNKPAALKAWRQAKKAALKHLQIKEKLDSLERKIKKALPEKKKDTLSLLTRQWQKACDKASKTKAIKKNKANRLKSRLLAKINAIK